MGGIANMAPQDYRVIIAAGALRDVVTTIARRIDPLTTNEFDEWGNPADQQYYEYMLSYSALRPGREAGLPGAFRRTGYGTRRCSTSSPTKWVARLRTHKTTTTRWSTASTWRPGTAASRPLRESTA